MNKQLITLLTVIIVIASSLVAFPQCSQPIWPEPPEMRSKAEVNLALYSDAMREKMMKMRDDRNAAYKEVLTPDQYKQFTDMQEQRMREMREQREQQGNPPPGGGQGGTDRPERGRGRN